MQEKIDTRYIPAEIKKYYKVWLKHINISNDIFNKQLKLTNMRQCWLTSHDPRDAVLPGDFHKLKDKNEVEMAVLYCQQIDIYSKINYFGKKMNNVYKITADNSVRRKVTKNKKRTMEREMCSICLENHSIKDVVTTSCGHHFGKSCFEQIIEKCSRNCTQLSCPLCRNTEMGYYRYYVK